MRLPESPLSPPSLPLKRIAIRIWDWSEWCRQVVRGVQHYAYEQKNWRPFVDVGQKRQLRLRSSQMALDGIITHVAPARGGEHEWVQGRPIPVVYCAATLPPRLAMAPRVRANDARVAEGIGRHLLAGGFRHLAFCGARDDAAVPDSRRIALEAFAHAKGRTLHVFRQRFRPKYEIDEQALLRWLKELPKPVGIATWQITIARQVVEACQQLEVAVPEEVGVISWDDDPMLAETLEPAISAAVLPAERLGYEAARLLDRLLAGETYTEPVLVEPSGVVRVRQSSDTSMIQDRDLRLAVQYIREHAAEPLKVPDIARAMGVSRKKLEIDFARVLKTTPNDLLTRERLEVAKRLLLESGVSIDRIAAASGLGTSRTLRNLFALHEQMTPGEYRARFGKLETHRHR
ncbi:MAG: substrate-binding domain-containing protein [Tepidisphaeraceae bacterium]